MAGTSILPAVCSFRRCAHTQADDRLDSLSGELDYDLLNILDWEYEGCVFNGRPKLSVSFGLKGILASFSLPLEVAIFFWRRAS